MAKSSKIGIIYGAVSGTVRRIVVPDNDSELFNPATHVTVGEQMLVVARMDLVGGVPDLPACIAAVESFRGQKSKNPRCAVTDKKGNVVDVVLADPAIDAVPGYNLVRHAEAVPGWAIDVASGALVAPVSVDVVATDVAVDAVIDPAVDLPPA